MITFILYKKITFLYLDLRLYSYAIFNVLASSHWKQNSLKTYLLKLNLLQHTLIRAMLSSLVNDLGICVSIAFSLLWSFLKKTLTSLYYVSHPASLAFHKSAPVLHIGYAFSLERRWSSHTFRYGYLVTTSQDPGTYSTQRADLRLLAIPTSCTRVAECNPNWGWFLEICSPSQVGGSLFHPL